MLHTLLTKIGMSIAGMGLMIGGLLGAPGVDLLTQNLGSTVPQLPANFETSLASPILSTDTSMTLVSGTLADGTTLSGYTCFVVDSGLSNSEFICGTASSTSVTSLVRGINPTSGTTTVSALQFSHRRGADVKVSDYPAIGVMRNILAGVDGFPGAVRYDTGVATTTIILDGRNLVNYSLLQSTAFSGAVPASTTTLGLVKMSTDPSSASSPIAVGTNDVRLTGKSGTVLSSTNPPIDLAYTATTSTANRVVTASSTGLIDNSFIDSGTTASKIVKLDASAKLPAVDGSQLTNLPGSGLIYSTSTATTVASSASETNFASTTIPANTISTAGSVLRLRAHISAFAISGTSNSATFRFKYGGTTLATNTFSTNASNGAGTGYSGTIEFVIIATSTAAQKGVAVTQVAIGTFGNNAGSLSGASASTQTGTANGTVDATAAQSLVCTVQFSNSGANDNVTIQDIVVEKIK
jgi:hypothetical protein